MRLTTVTDRQRYGCEDCADAQVRGSMCPHKECPYAKDDKFHWNNGFGLDNYSSYEEYLEKGGFSQFKRRFQ